MFKEPLFDYGTLCAFLQDLVSDVHSASQEES